MTKERKSTDILILGLSITGIGLAMELLRKGRNFEILDLDDDHALRGFYRVGPTPLNRHPVTGMDFHYPLEQVLKNKGKWFHITSVEQVENHNGTPFIETMDNLWQAKHIVYAPNGTTWWRRGQELESQLQPLISVNVSFCAWSDAFFFKDEKIAIYGQGNWAANLALIAREFSDQVTIINPESALQLAPFMQQELSEKNLKVINNASIRAVKKDPTLDRITITVQTGMGTTQVLPFKALFMGENLCLPSFSATLENSPQVLKLHTGEELNAFDHHALYEKGLRLAERF